MGLRKLPKVKFVSNREAFLVNLCRGKSILHLGCADAIHLNEHMQSETHLHDKLSKVAKSLYGVDIDENAISKLAALGFENLYVGDVESLNLQLPQRYFDIILVGELIEHLNCPGAFLKSIKRFMARDTTLIITTPNVLSLKLWLHAFLFGRQRIHPDHTLGFTFSLLETLLERHGFKVVSWYTSLETFHASRNKLARFIFRPLFHVLPHFADTIIVVAKLADYVT